jgi:hypothetical protein
MAEKSVRLKKPPYDPQFLLMILPASVVHPRIRITIRSMSRNGTETLPVDLR